MDAVLFFFIVLFITDVHLSVSRIFYPEMQRIPANPDRYRYFHAPQYISNTNFSILNVLSQYLNIHGFLC